TDHVEIDHDRGRGRSCRDPFRFVPRSPQALLFPVEPDQLDRAFELLAAERPGERVELRDAETVVDRALPEVPAVEVRADQNRLRRTPGNAHTQIGDTLRRQT